MKKSAYVLLILLWLVAACGTGTAPAQTPIPPSPTALPPVATPTPFEVDESRPLLVLRGTLIDGTGADPLPDAALVLQGDRIVAVGPSSEVSIPSDAQVFDLPQATILPGFINTHVHNAYNARTLRTWAQAGVTTVRDLGHRFGRPYFTMRDRLRADARNARVIAAGPLVTVPGGYPIAGNDFPSLTITSPEDARDQIEQLIDDGAEVIKITLTSGRAPSLSPEEAAAIVETAHEHGIPVTAHATTAQDLRRALDAGVDDVAHIAVDRVPNRDLRRMVEAGVSWVPTFEPLENRGQENLRRFLEAGGRVALGNDAGYLPGIEVGMPLREVQAMREAGMTPMQIIVAATRDAAHVCRLSEVLGTLEVGKVADVLVVEGNPLQDLQALKEVRLVVHGGVIIREPVPTTTPARPTRTAAISPATAVPPRRTPRPEPPADTGSRILFIGNSHTFVNDLPGMFAEMVDSGGHEVHVESSAMGGYTLEQHMRDGRTQEKLDDVPWDFVILQENIQNLTVESLRNTRMAPAVRALNRQIRAQGAQTVLALMWASLKAVDQEGLAQFASDQAPATAALRQLGQELELLIAPVGPAWEESLRQRPELALWGSDGHHASPAGTYLMACVLYATIYQHSPVGLSVPANLPEDTAQFLQELAEGVVESNLE